MVTQRYQPNCLVYASIENPEHDRCVDFFSRPEDGSFGFEEFRRDPEDGGRWTAVRYFSTARYPDGEAARTAAEAAIVWFRECVRTA